MADAVKFDRDRHRIAYTGSGAKIGAFLSLFTKFALDSAVNISLKGFSGGKKAYSIVQERLIYQPHPVLLDSKNKCKEVESAVAMEELQELMNNLKPQNKTSAEPAEGSVPHKKIPNEGVKESDLLNTNEKRIFIRSRL